MSILYGYSYSLLAHARPAVPADFTGDPPLHLNDIRRAGESEAPQNSLPALELVHLQDGPSFLQLPLGRSNICCNLKQKHMHTNTYCYTMKPLSDVHLEVSGFLEKIQRINCTLTWPHTRSSWQSSDTSLSQWWSGYLLPAHIDLSVIHFNLKTPEHYLTLQSQKTNASTDISPHLQIILYLSEFVQ